MPTQIIKVDLVIIGGGIAGLWALSRARQQGYSAILFEQDALGSEQTISSQGMIHGGVKYALAGKLSGESEAIAAMPALWERCLTYNASLATPVQSVQNNAVPTHPLIPAIDLSQTTLLSRDFYLWSSNLLGRLGSFFASKSLRGRVEALRPAQYPAVLQHRDFKGSVYRLIDTVVDIPSLLENFLALNSPHIFKICWQQAHWDTQQQLLHLNKTHCVKAQRFIFTAGKGNAALLDAWGETTPQMQLRPLQQVLVKHRLDNAMLYGHCIGTQMQASPRLSISSHRCKDGQSVWYLGGDLATQNARTDADVLIKKAQRELTAVFPWLPFDKAQWATLQLDRAEPRQATLLKPDAAFVEVARDKPLMTAWPTKLTLAPDMAEKIIAHLAAQAIYPQATQNLHLLAQLEKVGIAAPPWERLFNA